MPEQWWSPNQESQSSAAQAAAAANPHGQNQNGQNTPSSGIGGSIRDAGWPIIFFMIVLCLPPELGFKVGPLYLSWYRTMFLFFFLPCLWKLFNGTIQRHRCDTLFILFFAWAFLSLLLNHGISVALETGGSFALDGLGAYLLARTYIKDDRSFAGFCRLFVSIVLLFMVLSVPESVTGIPYARKLAAIVGRNAPMPETDMRLGFYRAFVTFDHPILYGVFCGNALALSWFIIGGKLLRRTLRCIAIGFATASSFSSGAVTTYMTQLTLIIWNFTPWTNRRKWWGFIGILAVAYLGIDILSNRDPLRVAISYLTFNPSTAYGRIVIWQYGSAEVIRHPWIGIGLNDWIRAEWLLSSSMDNFWLLTSMRYGLPAFCFLAGGVLSICYSLIKTTTLSPTQATIRLGWLLSLIGYCLAGCTVHFWNTLLVFFCFFIGSGVWLTNPQPLATLAQPEQPSSYAGSNWM